MKVFLIAPSSFVDNTLLKKGIELLQSHGFEVQHQPNITDQYFLFSGPTQRRSFELMSQLKESTTDIIWCARGGFGSNELLDELKKLPSESSVARKYFIGFSDTTPIQNILAIKNHLRVIYGLAAAVGDFLTMPKKNWEWLKTLLSQKRGNTHSVGYTFFSGKKIEGRVIGGNLSMLVSLLGTPFDFPYEDKILFLEDVNEPFHRVARQLHQLLMAGKLKKLRGIVFGKFNIRSCVEEELHMVPLLEYYLSNLNLPIIYNFPCGHVSDCMALPLNTPVVFENDSCSFTWGE